MLGKQRRTMTEAQGYQQKISILEQEIHQLKKQQSSQPSSDSDPMLDKIADYFLTTLNKNENLFERLPIHKIDGLKLDVFIKSYKIHDSIKINLIIEDAVEELLCLDDDYIGYHEYFRKQFELKNANSTEMKRIVEEIRMTLNNLEFCKLHGILVEKGKHKLETSTVWKSLIVSDNIEWSTNECAVCMDDTFSTTICGHHLCRCCFQKLLKSKCPTCRQPLSCDDDSDEESND